MALRSGTRLGPYELLALLGAGGMGEVYRARDTRLDRHVAVKVIPPSLARDRRRLKRFELEARAVAALNHPSIVSIFDVGTHKGTRFVVMELAEGETLRQILSRGPLPVRAAMEVAIQAAEGLEAAHAKGIVHRDLTPGNLIATPEGRTKVLDFGLAKLVSHAMSTRDGGSRREESSISEEGSVVGTVPYMAPEQIRGEPVDARTDLFALGVVLYEMVTGRRPFTGDTAADVASAILRDPPPPARELRADLPEELERILDRCLEKEPARRFGSARELIEALRRGIAKLESSPTARTSGRSGVTTLHSAVSFSVPTVPSIAVLPFANRSPDPEDEYFSEGLADELTNVLAKVPGLRVAGRTSTNRFKGKAEDLRDIGRKLQVSTLVEGSVRKSGDRVRVAVQLVKASDGFQLWSESYDRTLDDIFAVQDSIAQSVVKALRTTLLGEATDSGAREAARADVAAAVRGRGSGGEAYRLFLRGRYFVNRSTPEDVRKGIGFLIEALQADPTLALAWAELSGAYAVEAGYGWAPIHAGIERARGAAERALALEPDLPEGLVRLGAIQMLYDRDFGAAEASIRRALACGPGIGIVLRMAGNLTSNLGKLDEAIGFYRRAADQDPLGAAAYHTLGITYHAAGRHVEAEEAFRTALELAPQRVGLHYGLALSLLERGRAEEALEETSREQEEVFRLWSSAVVLHALGRPEESDGALGELIRKYAEGGAYQIAEVYAARGEVNEAFEWLERAYAQQDGGLVEMKPEPVFRSLHADPRWAAFLKRMGLPEDA
jgi:serine/threonine protein kinase